MNKSTWLANELPRLNELAVFQNDLLNDYLKGSNDIGQAIYARSFNMGQWATEQSQQYQENAIIQPDGWRATEIRFMNENRTGFDQYPTAKKIIDFVGPACSEATYLILLPNTEMTLHRDHENQDRQSLRCHIPLMVPQGDCKLEVNGQEYYHNQILAFDNQELHRAWNRTEYYRLIFSLTVTRHWLGLTQI